MFFSALLLVLSLLVAPALQAETFNESDLKAAFLYYFSHYISWPNQSAENENTPLKLCVLGVNDVTQSLELILGSPKAANTALDVYRISKPLEALKCNIVYIGPKSRDKTASVVAVTRGKPILTVGDSDGFLDAGGMIELQRKSNKVKVRINNGILSTHGLKASSKLLNLADIVTTPNLDGVVDVATQ